MTLAEKIQTYAAALPEGAAFKAKEVLHLGSRAAVDQALARLERSGAILRISRGLYVQPSIGRFGPRTPSPNKVITALANATGETIVLHGAAAANALGLTTQTPIQSVYLTSGRSRALKVGKHKVELRHAPNWTLVLPGQPAGDAVRALAWAGKSQAGEALSIIRRKLPAAEKQSLLNLRGQLPSWLADEVSSLARG